MLREFRRRVVDPHRYCTLECFRQGNTLPGAHIHCGAVGTKDLPCSPGATDRILKDQALCLRGDWERYLAALRFQPARTSLHSPLVIASAEISHVRPDDRTDAVDETRKPVEQVGPI